MNETIRINVRNLKEDLDVTNLFKINELKGDKPVVSSNTNLPLEAGYYLSGIMQGEEPSHALIHPYIANALYAAEFTTKKEDATQAYDKLEGFNVINEGTVLNAVTMVNNINCYYSSEDKKLEKKLNIEIIDDTLNVANKIVEFAKQNQFIENVYDCQERYYGTVHRLHKMSICKNKIFYCDVINKQTLLELISNFLLLAVSKTKDLTMIKEISLFDPIKNIEAVCDVKSISNELKETIKNNIL